MKHFKVLAQQHGVLTVKPTIRDAATRVPLPDIDLWFHKENMIWDSSKSKYNEAQLEEVRAYIKERNDRGDVSYVILPEDTVVPEPKPEDRGGVISGVRTTAHQAKGK